MGNRPGSIGSSKATGIIGAICLAAFGVSLRTRGLIHDDAFILGRNPLLRQGLGGAARLLVTGYWDAVNAHLARIGEYRPLLMETFWVQTWLRSPLAAFHGVNLLFHFAACALLLAALSRHLRPRAALFGAMIFAALPVHAEAVDLLTGRSELMCGALLLAAWLSLEAGRPVRKPSGLAFYAAALLTKESAVLFPIILAAGDWTLHGAHAWGRERRGLHARLWALSLLYMGLRRAVLGTDFQGGRPYFASRVTALATLPGFALKHYAWPAVSGLGLCTDFSRPLVPDASFHSWTTWEAAALAAAALGAAILACRDKRPWGFAVLGPALVLLPTCHLLMPLDTIGAQRFLYVPTMGAAALAGHWLDRLGETLAWPCVALVLAWYVSLSASTSAGWTTGASYYERAVACNPVSIRALCAWGANLAASGDAAQGERRLQQARAADPAFAGPYYNLGLLAWQRGDAAAAERWLSQAVRRDEEDADSWTLLGAALAAQGRDDRALDCYRRGIALSPDQPEAHYNAGRLLLKRGDRAEANDEFARFLQLSPDDPDAPTVARLRQQLAAQR